MKTKNTNIRHREERSDVAIQKGQPQGVAPTRSAPTICGQQGTKYCAPTRFLGFTLVELIVVITVLAILGTIGFLSLQWHSGNSRDSKRISEMSAVVKTLELHQIGAGSYPPPDNSFAVTYSGGVVWNQWTVGTGVIQRTRWILKGNGISNIPRDPLNNAEFDYSSLAYGLAFQIKVDFEGETTSFSPFIDRAYASAGNPNVAYIKGNFVGLTAKTFTGGVYYLVALPSLISGTGSTGETLEIKDNTLSGALLFHNRSNTEGIAFNPTVVFSGASLPKDDTGSGITNMMLAIKSAYQNIPELQTNEAIRTVVNSSTWELASLGADIIQKQLGGTANVPPPPPPPLPTQVYDDCIFNDNPVAHNASVIAYQTPSVSYGDTCTSEQRLCTDGTLSGSYIHASCSVTMSNSCAADPSFANRGTLTTGTPTSVNQTWSYSATPGNCTYTCNNGYSGNNCTTAPWTVAGGGDCTYVSNSLGSNGNTSTCTDPRAYTMQWGATHDKTYNLLKIEGRWWFNENLAYPPASGYQGSDTWSTSDLGYYSCLGTNSTTTADCASVATLGYLYQWSAAMSGTLSNNNPGARTQGICPSGWGLPTKTDFTSAGNSYWPANDVTWLGNTTGWTRTFVGCRKPDGIFDFRASYEFAWSSFETSSKTIWAWLIYFDSGSDHTTQSVRADNSKAYGLSVRCIKN